MAFNYSAYKRSSYSILGHEIQLLVPQDAESSLNAAVSGDGVDPYWGKVWDSALDTARCILKSRFRKGVQTLEIGCGIGLVGVAASIAGHRVTFSDHDPNAVNLAMENAKLNAIQNYEGIILDWQRPIDQRFDVILASDILYESSLHSAILDVGSRMLNENGQMYIGDPGRHLARDFLNLASSRGWSIQIFDKDYESVLTPFNNHFQLIVLGRTQK